MYNRYLGNKLKNKTETNNNNVAKLLLTNVQNNINNIFYVFFKIKFSNDLFNETDNDGMIKC